MSDQLSEFKYPELELRNITKVFPGVVANDKINFDCRSGEVHTLLGENGAGKSTLMNVLSGLYPPDEGEIFLRGKKIHFANPSHAIKNGIGMVHQHFMLIQNHTVAENIILGTPQAFNLKLSKISNRIGELGEKYNLTVDPYKKIQDLTVGEQQRVEILKVLYRGAKILILDEPTAVLTPQESEALYKIIRKMIKEKYSIIFISHKMKEVTLLSDRITILSKGRAIATIKRGEASINKLASMMMDDAGRDENKRNIYLESESRPEQSSEKPVVKINDICAQDRLGNQVLHNIDMEIYKGEIAGLAGVSGNGQVALAEVLSGMLAFTKGSYEFNGKKIEHADVIKMSKLGVGYIPEDRKKFGMVEKMSIAYNFLMRDYTNPDFYNKFGVLKTDKIYEYTKNKMKKFDVRAASEKTAAGTLSGGNIQKMILARELSRYLRFLLACQPIRGLDINASGFIHETILKAKKNGLAVLLISEDIDELVSLSDRIYVICQGEIVGSLLKEDANIEKIGLMMTGVEVSSCENPN
ncbi:MAG: ABC transporter ATP-binding protein [Deltaproteobacteria bacterium]|nr:ABC transporter ATP-binding protein [Deltaproteobacteria bacterium]